MPSCSIQANDPSYQLAVVQSPEPISVLVVGQRSRSPAGASNPSPGPVERVVGPRLPQDEVEHLHLGDCRGRVRHTKACDKILSGLGCQERSEPGHKDVMEALDSRSSVSGAMGGQSEVEVSENDGIDHRHIGIDRGQQLAREGWLVPTRRLVERVKHLGKADFSGLLDLEQCVELVLPLRAATDAVEVVETPPVYGVHAYIAGIAMPLEPQIFAEACRDQGKRTIDLGSRQVNCHRRPNYKSVTR